MTNATHVWHQLSSLQRIDLVTCGLPVQLVEGRSDPANYAEAVVSDASSGAKTLSAAMSLESGLPWLEEVALCVAEIAQSNGLGKICQSQRQWHNSGCATPSFVYSGIYC